MADYETTCWGAGIERLRTIKSKYDPHNVFSLKLGIKPEEAMG
jgi:hypothetical protein